MDFWLAAAVAGAGYFSKYWKNLSRDNGLSQLSSGDSDCNKPESPCCPLRSLTNRPKQRANVTRDGMVANMTLSNNSLLDDAFGVEVSSTNYQDSGELLVSNLQSGFSGKDEFEDFESWNRLADSGSDDHCGLSPNLYMEEVDFRNSCTSKKKALRTKRSYAISVRPVNSLESCLMAQIHKERDEMEEYVLSSLQSQAKMTMGSLLVTDGSRVISNSHRESFSSQIGDGECTLCKETCVENVQDVFGVPPLKSIGSMDPSMKVKAKTQKGQKGKVTNGKDFNPHDGSSDGVILLCLGISIGIISSFMASKREVDKLKESLKQSENLVQDLQEELEMKSSLMVKELVTENYTSQDSSDNSISKRVSDMFPLELNIDSSAEHEGSDSYIQKVVESSESISKIEAELEAELERLGLNLNASALERRLSDFTEPSSTTRKFAQLDPVLSVDFAQGELRVDMVGVEDVSKSKSNDDKGASTSTTHDTANYAVSPRELSLRLHEVIQSRLEQRVNELEIALQNSHRKIRQRYSPIAKDHKSAIVGAHEELMKMSDSEEEDSPRRIYDDINCSESLPGVFPSQDGLLFGSEQDFEIPEEKTIGELFPSSLRMQDERISLVLGSNETSNSGDEISDCDDEVERELIKQIVERTKKGSDVVINAQRLLFSLEENDAPK